MPLLVMAAAGRFLHQDTIVGSHSSCNYNTSFCQKNRIYAIEIISLHSQSEGQQPIKLVRLAMTHCWPAISQLEIVWVLGNGINWPHSYNTPTNLYKTVIMLGGRERVISSLLLYFFGRG